MDRRDRKTLMSLMSKIIRRKTEPKTDALQSLLCLLLLEDLQVTLDGCQTILSHYCLHEGLQLVGRRCFTPVRPANAHNYWSRQVASQTCVLLADMPVKTHEPSCAESFICKQHACCGNISISMLKLDLLLCLMSNVTRLEA